MIRSKLQPQKPNAEKYELRAEDLRFQKDPLSLGFESTSELTAEARIVGQDKAMGHLRDALTMEADRYNVYVKGPDGETVYINGNYEESAGRTKNTYAGEDGAEFVGLYLRIMPDQVIEVFSARADWRPD